MTSRLDKEISFTRMWGDLAIYNAERARGLVHTPEWQEKMADKQVQYNAWIQNTEEDHHPF